MKGDSYMTELEKCMAGEYYNCHDKIFLGYKANARKLLSTYNSLHYDRKIEKREILEKLFGTVGDNELKKFLYRVIN